jgi:ADP-ribosylglycohydrolase
MAPVGLLFYNEPSYAFEVGCDLAAITHGHPSGYLAAGTFACIISLLVQGGTLDKSIDQSVDILKTYAHHEEMLNAIKLARQLYLSDTSPQDSIRRIGEGWVAEEALAIAIYCGLRYHADFTKGILLSVEHNGDSDTTGAITGNLLGVMCGAVQLPVSWKQNLQMADVISQVGEDVFEAATQQTYEWCTRYPFH